MHGLGVPIHREAVDGDRSVGAQHVTGSRGRLHEWQHPQRGKTHTAYWFTIDPATGKRVQHSKGGFPKQKAARTHLNTILSKVEEGLWTPNSKMTVKEFVDSTWLPSLDAAAAGGSLKPTTVAFYRHIVMRYVLTPLGGVKLASLAATMLNSFYGDLLKNGRASGRSGLSPTTVSRVHVTVHRMLRDAVRWGLLQRNVADQATAPRPRKQQLAPWSPRETGQFLQASSGTRLGPLWHLAAMTGLRRGEVCRCGGPTSNWISAGSRLFGHGLWLVGRW